MDVLLINPKNIFEKKSEKVKAKFALSLYPPLGILYIASVLEKKRISVEIVDAIASDISLEEIIHNIQKNKPKIIGITATTPQIRGAVQIAQLIKKQYCDDIVIGIGGPHVSADKSFIERFNCFDFSIEGEGEITFSEIVLEVLNGKKIRGNYKGEIINNLDENPFPARHLISNVNYYIKDYGKHFATIHTTRGCPFNCVYCSNPVTDRKMRFRSPTNVVDEMQYCINTINAKLILFTDDTFTANRKRTEEICLEIMKRNFKVDWFCETRADLVDRDLLELMYKSGCKEISFGVETGNEKLRFEVIRKRINDLDLIKAFELCREMGIKTSAFCMLGFPTETEKDMYETYKLCLKLKPDTMGLHLTVPMPGADIFYEAIREKKIDIDIWDQYAKGLTSIQPVYIPNGFSLSDLREVQKDIYRKYYFRPQYIISRFISDFKSFESLKQDAILALNLLYRSSTTTGRP
ncbi:MAG: hypothetical protein A2W22_05060 [Candidatus Levybacteria bacterium RBG_16_35_11]|nr:MAG: hypothetical protein A2W22_05060 [Candidatus Levybacteria bacterium RBG_16_35_11]